MFISLLHYASLILRAFTKHLSPLTEQTFFLRLSSKGRRRAICVDKMVVWCASPVFDKGESAPVRKGVGGGTPPAPHPTYGVDF
jgi:hypothetical protein